MKFLLVLVAVVAVAVAQRATYAGIGPKGRPGLASRFKDTEETATVALANRIGEDGSTPKIPVDARGDVDLVNRLNQWPRDNQPFWLLNAEHIEASRNPQRNNIQPDLQSRSSFDVRPSQPRSSFLGPLN